eukprot:13491_4
MPSCSSAQREARETRRQLERRGEPLFKANYVALTSNAAASATKRGCVMGPSNGGKAGQTGPLESHADPCSSKHLETKGCS